MLFGWSGLVAIDGALGSGGGVFVHCGPKSCIGALVTVVVQKDFTSITGSIITGV